MSLLGFWLVSWMVSFPPDFLFLPDGKPYQSFDVLCVSAGSPHQPAGASEPNGNIEVGKIYRVIGLTKTYHGFGYIIVGKPALYEGFETGWNVKHFWRIRETWKVASQ